MCEAEEPVSLDGIVHFTAEGPGPRARARGEWKARCAGDRRPAGDASGHPGWEGAGTRDSAVQQMAVTGYDSRTGPRSSGPWAGPLWGRMGPGPGLQAVSGPGKGGSWADVEGEEPFCRGRAVVHSHVCHQAEWPCLPKAAHLSLIPSSAHLQLSPQRPGAQLRGCRCQLVGSLQGPPRSRPQGVNSNGFRITLSPPATCHLPLWPHCPRHSTPHAALWQVGRRLAEEASPEAPKPDVGLPPCLLPAPALGLQCRGGGKDIGTAASG